MTFNFIFNLTAQETRQLIALYDVTCPVFFFAFQKERRGEENNIGKFMFVSLSLSLSPSVMWFCLPLSPSHTHAFYVFFIDVKQA